MYILTPYISAQVCVGRQKLFVSLFWGPNNIVHIILQYGVVGIFSHPIDVPHTPSLQGFRQVSDTHTLSQGFQTVSHILLYSIIGIFTHPIDV